MGSSRVWPSAAAQVLVFGAGASALAAGLNGFYASALVLVLSGAWGGTILAWRAARPATHAPTAPVTTPDPAAAERERRMLRSLVDQAPAPLLMLHADGAVRAGNRAARALFGVDDLLPDPPPALTATLADAAPGERRVVRLGAEGAARAYALSVADVAAPQGPVRLAALVDIQAEIQAAEATALRDLLQVLSHEIMNSLTPVVSLAGTAEDLLRDEDSEPVRLARDAVATLARRTEGLTRFVEAYRALARLPPPTLKPVSITALIEEAARLFRGRWTGQGVRLEAHTPEPDLVLRLDADLMIQALLNILANGAEAALETRHPPTCVVLHAEAVGGGVEIRIIDNGEGVRLDEPAAIFRPFFTTKPTGTGVGLSLARQVLLSHGGDLVLAPPAPDRGAELILRL